MPLEPVEVFDGSSSLRRIRHEDEAASASRMVEGSQNYGMFYRAKLGKELLELLGRSIQRKIKDVQVALSTLAISSHFCLIYLQRSEGKDSGTSDDVVEISSELGH